MKRIKILSVILGLLILISVFAACSGADESNDTDKSKAENSRTDDVSETSSEPEFVLTEQKYEGRTFTILTSGVNAEYHSEIITKENNENHNDNEMFPDRINEAINRRNEQVKEFLGVEIKEKYIHDTGRYNGTTIEEIRKEAESRAGNFQAVNVCLYDCGILSLEGMLYDLNSLENINMTNPWWDQSVNKEVTIDGKQYFMVGDVGINNKSSTPVVYFNESLFNRLNLENPYELVNNYEWTIDKAYKICKDANFAADLNNDGKITYDDNFCWGGQYDDMTAMFYGAGVNILSTDSEGYPMLSVESVNTSNIVDAILELMTDKQVYVSANDYFGVAQWPTVLVEQGFIDGRSLFYSASIGHALRLDDMEDTYGILPIPMYNKEQEAYNSLINTWTSNGYAIAMNDSAEEAEFAAAVFDVMGRYAWVENGTNNLSIEYYDIVLKGQRLNNDEAGEVLDKVFATRGVDLGHIFRLGNSVSKPMTTLLSEMIAGNQTGQFNSKYEAVKSAMEIELADLIKAFRE